MATGKLRLEKIVYGVIIRSMRKFSTTYRWKIDKNLWLSFIFTIFIV